MKQIGITNLSTAKDSFACILVSDAISKGSEELVFTDIKVERIRETEQKIFFKLTNVEKGREKCGEQSHLARCSAG